MKKKKKLIKQKIFTNEKQKNQENMENLKMKKYCHNKIK